ncbi:MAG: hypothetical protein KDE27_32210 [Planctomycetes bacterium]|nr:hypothetical protein [Planctomycetota bacterium]
MGRVERRIAAAWAALPDEELDRRLAGAERRGELDRLLAGAGERGVASDRPLPRWPQAVLLAAAAVVVIWIVASVTSGGSDPLAAALESVRTAHVDGAPVANATAETLRRRLGDDAVAAILLADPFDARVFDDTAGGTGAVRGADERGLRLRRPAATIATARPEFRLDTGLPDDAAWRIEVRLERVDSSESHAMTVEHASGAGSVCVFELEPGIELAAGTWRLEARLAAAPALGWATARAEFRVAPPERVAELEAGLPATGDAGVDRALLAARLLAAGFAERALALLDATPPASGEAARAEDLLLRVRARALLGDRDEIERLRVEWRALRSRLGRK